MKRRVLSCILALAMVLSMLPVTALAADGAVTAKAITPFEGEGTENAPYEIPNLATLEAFREYINEGNGEGEYFKLTGNINMSEKYGEGLNSWTPIGVYANRFNGIFDGDGKIITGLYINTPSSSSPVGLFGYVGGGTVKNLGVVGGYVSGNIYVSGIVGYNGGTVKDCYNTVTVSGFQCVGGIAGHNANTVESCYNTGTILDGYMYVGGIVGSNEYGTVTNCYNTGEVSGYNNIGGIAGRCLIATIENSYNIGDIVGNINAGGVLGYSVGSGVTNSYYLAGHVSVGNNYGTSKTEAEFNSGEVTWLLQDGQSTQVWGQTITGATDKYPVLTSNAPKKVLKVTFETKSNKNYAEKYTNLNGTVTVPEPEEGYKWTWNNTDFTSSTPVTDDITVTAVKKSPFDGEGTATAPYEIPDLATLELFRDYINDGNGAGEYFKLTANINMTQKYGKDINGTEVSWTPIGNSSNQFKGTFDGDGKKISGLYINSNESFQGLFGCVGTGGTVKNLSVDGAVTGGNYVGGVVGRNYDGTVENCYNTGTVTGSEFYVGGVVGDNRNGGMVKNCHNTGTVTGSTHVGGVVGSNYAMVTNCYNTGTVTGRDYYVGGVVGYNSGTVKNGYNTGDVNGGSTVGGVVGANRGSSTVENCYNIGAVSSGSSAGGVVGWNSDNSMVENCYNIGAVNGSSTVGGVVGNNSAMVMNCYYLNTCVTNGANYGTSITAAVFANKDTFSNWDFDKIWEMGMADGENVRPILQSNKETDIQPLPIFSRGDGKSEQTAYEIPDLETLEAFRDYINEGNGAGEYFKLTANINMTAKYKNAGKSWDTIGTYISSSENKPFTGIFDGDGHTITGLYINKPDVDYQGLFGYIGKGGTVKNLGLSGGSVTGGFSVGGIAGYSNGSVINCFNACDVTSAKYDSGSLVHYSSAGGIVGYSSSGSVEKCYNTGTITGKGQFVGGIIGYDTNSSVKVTNCYNTGEVSGSSNVGGITGYTGTLSNCHNVGTVMASKENGYVGGIRGIGGTSTNNYYLEGCVIENVSYGTSKTKAEFSSGEVAQLLQGSQLEQVWGQNVGTDEYPLLIASTIGKDAKQVLKVTFMANGREYAAKYVNSGGTVDLPATPEREGYQFLGWSESSVVSGTDFKKFTADTEVTEKITVYAVWQETYGGEGGTLTETYGYEKELTANLDEYMAYAGETDAAGKFTYAFAANGNGIGASLGGANNAALTVPTGLGAGTYTLVITATEKQPQVSAYAIGSFGTQPVTLTVTVKIEKAAPVVTAPNAKALTYTGEEQALVEAGTTTGGTLKYSLDGNEYSEDIPTGIEAKTYKVYYKVDGGNNYKDVAAQYIEVTIGKADATVTVGDKTITYGDRLELTATVGIMPLAAAQLNHVDFYVGEKLLGSVEIGTGTGSATLTLTHADTAYKYLEPGANKVKAVYNGSVNLNNSGKDNITVTVNQKTITAEITGNPTKTYDGSADIETATITLYDIESGDVVGTQALSFSFDSANAGSGKTVTANTITLTGGDAKYYELTGSVTGTGTVTPVNLTVPAAEFTYDGATQRVVEMSGVNGEKVKFILTAGSKNVGAYTYDENGGDDKYTVKIDGAANANNYTVTAGNTLTVNTRKAELEWTANTSFVYDGTQKSVTAALKNKVDGDNVELTYSGSFGTDAKDYTAKVTGFDGTDKDNYTLEGVTNTEMSWSIGKKSLAGADVQVTSTHTYNGTDQTDSVITKVTLGGVTLTAGQDYTVSFAKNGETAVKNAGIYTVIVTGTGNYAETANGSLTVAQKTLTPSIKGSTEKIYDTTNAAEWLTIDLDGVAAGDENDVRATAEFAYDSANVDAAAITASNITLDGDKAYNYVLSVKTLTISGKITAKTVTEPVIELEYTSTVYDGTAKRPTVTVKDGETIIPEAEYTVEYGNNTEAGTATVTITDNAGGNYTVSGNTSFIITAADSVVTLTANGPVTYGGNVIITATVERKAVRTMSAASDQVEFFVNGQSVGTENVIYSNDGSKDAGTATLSVDAISAKYFRAGDNTVTAVYGGSKNLSGSNSAEINVVVNAKLVNAVISGTATKIYDGERTITGLTLTLNGVESGDDVTATAAEYTFDDAAAGTGKMLTASGITLSGVHAGNYTVAETVTATGSIEAKPITVEMVKAIAAQTYTGTEITPEVTVTDGSTALMLGTDYSVKYGNNVNAGTDTATVTVTGQGNYTGEVNVTFTIKKAQIQEIPDVQLNYIDEILVGTDETMEWADEKDSAVWTKCEADMSVVDYKWDIEDNDIYIRYAGDSNHEPGEALEFFIPARPDAPDQIKVFKTDTTITITNINAAADCEYSLDGETWQDEETFADLTPGTSYTLYVRTKAVDSVFGVSGISSLALDAKEDTAIGAFASASTTKKVITQEEDGSTTLMPGESVSNGDGTVSNDGDNVTFQDGEGNDTTTVTPKEGDDFSGGVEVDGDGNMTVPDGSTVTPPNGPDITIGDNNGDNATVDENGNVTLPGEGSAQVGDSTVTVPDEGGTLTPDEDGSVNIPAGSVVEDKDGKKSTVPPQGGKIDSEGNYKANPGSGSGGYANPGYEITVANADNGKVTADHTRATSGRTVIITVTPDEGYYLVKLTVTDSGNNTVELTDKGEGTFTFIMPGGSVIVTAAFAPILSEKCDGKENCPSRAFNDLSTDAWYHEFVDYVISSDLMNGYGNGVFGPNNTLTRAMLAQILYNLEGGVPVNYLMQYDDIPADAWYAEAVRWATSEGIVFGYGNGKFGPDDPITREQLAVMLYRYEQRNGGGFTGNWMFRLDFTDAADVSDWAYEAVAWCSMNGIVAGKENGIFDPNGKATRAEVATMLMRFLERDK